MHDPVTFESRSSLDRRTFLRKTGSAFLAPYLIGLAARSIHPAVASPVLWGNPSLRVGIGRGGYGELHESHDCPELRIPAGFRLSRISRTLHPSLADSHFTVPQAFDGMAAFPGTNGTVRLVRNHEIKDPAETAMPFGSERVYDPNTGGGTTTLELVVHGSRNDRSIEVVREFPSLNGTHVNCAGGPTPWGSWLSCEETTEERVRKHGYVFEVPSALNGAADPVPLRAMGRFVHEAVAVDPASGIVHLTEDMRYEPENNLPGAGFYRFIPNRPGDLAAGGRLQMLAVREHPRYLTVTGQVPGAGLPVVWVEISNPDPADAAENPSSVFLEGHDKGGAIFHRLEGCWHGDGTVFFDATTGGDAGAGQIWQYRPAGADEGELTLVFESPGTGILDSPDNLCVSPRGGLVLCEDGDDIQFIRGLTPEGGIFDLAESVGPASEFAGACFSPDGEILFFNTQGSTRSDGEEIGTTYAMWGPWEIGVL